MLQLEYIYSLPHVSRVYDTRSYLTSAMMKICVAHVTNFTIGFAVLGVSIGINWSQSEHSPGPSLINFSRLSTK